MIEKFSEWVVRRRWWIILGSLAIFWAAASGIRLLTFSDNYRVFFSKGNPDLQAFEAMENIYTKDNNVLFAIAPKDGNVFTRQTLASVEWLTQEAWKLPYSTRVNSISNFQHTSAEGDELAVRNLVESAASLSDQDLGNVKRVSLAEPLLVNQLVSARGHVTAVNVNFSMPQKKLTETPEVAAAARDLAKRLEARDPNLKVYLTGVVMYNNAFNELAQKDLQTLVPIMWGVIVLVTFLILRSFTGTLVTLGAMIVSILTALGLAGWLGFRLTPSSAPAPTIIMTVAVADCIHLLLSMLHGMRNGLEKRSAIVESIKLNFRTLFLTAVNTIIGFLTLNTSVVPPYRDLGNIVAMGIAAALGFTVLLLPALLAVLPYTPKARLF